MKRIYRAGPMTGKPGFNRDEFEAAAKAVRDKNAGFDEMMNPHEFATQFEWDESTSIKRIAAVLMFQLSRCDAIYMLRGWQDSKGATAEHAVAKWIGLEIIYQGEAE